VLWYNIPVVDRVSSESDFKLHQELVHAGQQGLGGARPGGYTGRTVKHNDAIGQVCCHNEIVLHNETSLLGMQNKPLDNLEEEGHNINLLNK
jgi:hypothetical protein